MGELAVIQQTINTLLYGGMGYTVYDFVTSDRPQNFVENIKLLKYLNPWQKQQYPQRLEAFIQAQQELQQDGNVLNNLTDAERGSPASWLNQGFSAYMNEIIEEKVELLRNALLNGLYGNFEIEEREELCRIAQTLQPLDVLILRFLLRNCPNLQHAKSVLENSGDSQGVQRFEHMRQMTSFDSLIQEFQTVPQNQIRRSLDRLRSQELIFNPAPGFDFHDPYDACMPTEFAQTFLNYVSIPQAV
jgi:hypothetical protein